MLLTSEKRAMFYLGLPLTDKLKTREVMDWVTAISQEVENFLNRKIEIDQHEEYFDCATYKREYFPQATPILAPISLHYDYTGAFEGQETELSLGTDYIIGPHKNSFVLITGIVGNAIRGLRLVHNSGMASHAVESVFNMTITGGALSAGNFIAGKKSRATGLVVSSSGNDYTVEVLSGVFKVEDLDLYENETSETTIVGKTGTIVEIVSRCLAEAYPAIVRAVEIELRFMSKHRDDFENISTIQGQTARRNYNPSTNTYRLQPEAVSMLEKYQKNFIY